MRQRSKKNGAQVGASHLLCYGVSLWGRGGYFKIMLMRAVTSLTLISPSALMSPNVPAASSFTSTGINWS